MHHSVTPLLHHSNPPLLRHSIFFSLCQQFLDLLFEPTAGVHVAKVALLIDEPHRGDAVDAVLLAEFVFPLFAVKILRPCHFLIGDEFFQSALVHIETDADNLESFRMELVIGLFDMRELGHARPAPSRPEINQHHLVGEFADIDFTIINGGEFDGKWLA